MVRAVTIGFLMLVGAICHAQGVTSQSEQPHDTAHINLYDKNGLKNGYWVQERPATPGDYAMSEQGSYDHGKKKGKWYTLNGKGSVAQVETYNNDVKNGQAIYYDDYGHVTSTGTYRGLNPKNAFDTIKVTDPVTYVDYWKIISTDKGYTKDGLWKFYDPETGRMLREEMYQVDDLIYRKEYTFDAEDSVRSAKLYKALPRKERWRQNKKVPRSLIGG